MNILFDLDGTLTDSGPGIIRCARETLAHYGLPIPDDATMRTIVGPPLRASFLRFGIQPEELDEAVIFYRSIYTASGIFENEPYPGIPQLLQRLQCEGHKLYIATSKPEHMAVAIMKHFHMDHCFTMISGSLADGIRDQKSLVIAHVLEHIDNSNPTVMVGDTVYDIQGAAAHNMKAIAVAWGYGNWQDMLDAGAAALVHSADELYAFLQK